MIFNAAPPMGGGWVDVSSSFDYENSEISPEITAYSDGHFVFLSVESIDDGSTVFTDDESLRPLVANNGFVSSCDSVGFDMRVYTDFDSGRTYITPCLNMFAILYPIA